MNLKSKLKQTLRWSGFTLPFSLKYIIICNPCLEKIQTNRIFDYPNGVPLDSNNRSSTASSQSIPSFPIRFAAIIGILSSFSKIYLKNVSIIASHSGRPAKIRAGTIDLLGEEDRVEPQDINVVKTIVHLDYDTYPKSNNIGLMRLAKAVVFTSYVQPACLYTKSDVPDEMIVTGWGRILKTGTPREMRSIDNTVAF